MWLRWTTTDGLKESLTGSRATINVIRHNLTPDGGTRLKNLHDKEEHKIGSYGWNWGRPTFSRGWRWISSLLPLFSLFIQTIYVYEHTYMYIREYLCVFLRVRMSSCLSLCRYVSFCVYVYVSNADLFIFVFGCLHVLHSSPKATWCWCLTNFLTLYHYSYLCAGTIEINDRKCNPSKL